MGNKWRLFECIKGIKGRGVNFVGLVWEILLELEEVNLIYGNLNWERKYIFFLESKGRRMVYFVFFRKVRLCYVFFRLKKVMYL